MGRPAPHELPVYVPKAVARLLGQPFEVTPERLRRSQLERGLDPQGVVEVHGPALLRFLRDREHVRTHTDLPPNGRLRCFVQPRGALLTRLVPLRAGPT